MIRLLFAPVLALAATAWIVEMRESLLNGVKPHARPPGATISARYRKNPKTSEPPLELGCARR